MNKLTTYVKEHLFSSLMFLGTMVFYLFFAFYDGAVICVDSPTYIEMSFTREPFYPLFLAFFRHFTSENYLLCAVVVQSLLMALCSWKLADYLREKLHIRDSYSTLLYCLPIATSLLCRFAAKRSSMYTNSILTEGICTSLYLFFLYCILNYVWDLSRKHLVLSWLTAFIMVSSRKQMLMVLPLLFLAIIYTHYNQKKLRNGILIGIFACYLIFRFFSFFDCSYNYFVRGTFQGHSSSNRFLATMVFYNSERGDADYIQDEEARQLFLDIYDICDEKGYLGSHADAGWYNEAEHFGDHYDNIQIDTMWPMIAAHAKETLDAAPIDKSISEEEQNALYNKETDRLTSIIISSLLPHQLPKLMKTLFYNFLSGLVITIAQFKPILVPYTVVMFAAYGLLTLRLFLLCRRSLKAETDQYKLSAEDQMLSQRCVEFSILTLLGIISNVFLVSAVIFCQTRYTIYNMPLFYMAGAMLVYQNLKLLPKNSR